MGGARRQGCPVPPHSPAGLGPPFPQSNLPPSMMTRRNTYVCTERPGAERPSLLPNGKENRYEGAAAEKGCGGGAGAGEQGPP